MCAASRYLVVINSLVQVEKETLASSPVALGEYSVPEAAAADELCSFEVTSSQLSNLSAAKSFSSDSKGCTDSLEGTFFKVRE